MSGRVARWCRTRPGTPGAEARRRARSPKQTVNTCTIQLVTITLAGFAALAAEAAAPPSASELLDKYTQALDSTKSFASSSESTCLLNSRVPSWGLEMHDARSFDRAEERTDGRGHLYGRSLRWGYVSASEQHLTEANARYHLSVIGEDFMYNDDKGLGQTRFKGHVTYDIKGSSEYERKNTTLGYYNGDTVLGYFLGYMSAWRRLDEMLNPDHEALGSFANPMKNPALDPELVNGTIVYLGSGQKNTWQDGTVVDPNGKVVLDLRTNIPKPGRTAPGGKK